MEIELKLTLPSSALKALSDHPLLTAPDTKKGGKRDLKSTYYDTQDGLLRQAGFGLRVRETDGRFIQTLKGGSHGKGAASFRDEWEWPIETGAPDLALLGPIPDVAPLLPALEGGLAPIFVSEIERRIYLIHLGDDIVEAAIDEGKIVSGDLTTPVLELELELKSGQPESLYHLALTLSRDLPLRVDAESKSARGYRLRDGAAPAIEKFRAPTIPDSASARDAFQEMVGATLHHLLANLPATEAGDVEGLHQMRVAFRRLRTVLRAFRRDLEPHSAERFEKVAQSLGRILGDARDWDVFCEQILPTALEGVPDVARCGVEAIAKDQQQAARLTMQSHLASRDFSIFILSLSAWSLHADTDGALDKPLAPALGAMLDDFARSARKRAARAFPGADHDVHRFRKSLKRLRYLIDDLAHIYSKPAAVAYLKQCKHLQNALGEFNDASSAEILASRIAHKHNTSVLPALLYVWDWSVRRKQAMAEMSQKAWDEFAVVKPFW